MRRGVVVNDAQEEVFGFMEIFLKAKEHLVHDVALFFAFDDLVKLFDDLFKASPIADTLGDCWSVLVSHRVDPGGGLQGRSLWRG